MLHYLTVSVNRILKQPSNSVLLASGGNVLTASRAALQIYATSRLHVAGGVLNTPHRLDVHNFFAFR